MNAKHNRGKGTASQSRHVGSNRSYFEEDLMPDSRSARQWQRQVSMEDTGVLEQRVYHIEKAVADQASQTQALITNLAQSVNTQIQQVQQSTSSQISALATQIGNLGTKIEERAKIPWPALAVMLSFLVIIGTLVWYPIASSMGDVKQRMIELSANVQHNYVDRQEYTARTDSLTRLRDAQAQLVFERLTRLEAETKEARDRTIRDLERQVERLSNRSSP